MKKSFIQRKVDQLAGEIKEWANDNNKDFGLVILTAERGGSVGGAYYGKVIDITAAVCSMLMTEQGRFFVRRADKAIVEAREAFGKKHSNDNTEEE